MSDGTITTSSGVKVQFQRTGGVYVLNAHIKPLTNGSVVSAVAIPKKVTTDVESSGNKSPGFEVARKATSFQRQG